MDQQPDRSTEIDDIEGTSEAALSADEVFASRDSGEARDIVGGGSPSSVDGAYDDEERDPAYDAVIEAGGGVAEGFEQSEAALIDHATDSEGSTRDILFDAIDEDGDDIDLDVYGDGDDILESDLDD